MARDKILAMQPGREMADAVAERVMGWRRYTAEHTWLDDNRRIRCTSYEPGQEGRFRPDEDVGAAWEVVEKLPFFYLWRDTDGDVFEVGTWECRLSKEDDLRFYATRATTAPEAICKAALLAANEVIGE